MPLVYCLHVSKYENCITQLETSIPVLIFLFVLPFPLYLPYGVTRVFKIASKMLNYV